MSIRTDVAADLFHLDCIHLEPSAAVARPSFESLPTLSHDQWYQA